MASLSKLTPSQKRVVAAVFISGGLVALSQLRVNIRRAQREQKRLADASAQEHGVVAGVTTLKRPKVAVDAVFFQRLGKILRVCVPHARSKEALLVAIQTALLISRSILTERIAAVEGRCGTAVVSQNWPAFASTLGAFARICFPAAAVNSGLKYMQTVISLSFRGKLTEYLHRQYLSNRAYYAASTLGGLSNADQRITEDVEKFASTISELFSYTFKPVLDIILFTRSLARSIGYKGQFGLYLYFFLCSGILRSTSPPLALMATQEAALSGDFRSAHQRLVTNAEEVAFNDPPGGDTERLILDGHLRRLLRHARLSAFQRFIQQCLDGFLVKYAASIVGLTVYAAPLYFSSQKVKKSDDSPAKLTGDYIRSMRLMMSTASAIGQLVLVYKRITALAGNVSRVSELMESIKHLSSGESPRVEYGETIKFEHVTVHSPDGLLLVRDLTFEVAPGKSVIIMGPNGSGKSSLFRIMSELWPLECGIVTHPARQDVMYLSQRPYLVTGTLRDQILYPQPPKAVAAAAGRKAAAVISNREDAELTLCLEQVELGYLLQRGAGWDQTQPWNEVLSGGEKQRIAMARVLYARPRYAILDECTSAVSADGEEKLYKALLGAGITLLSIAHRQSLIKYHYAVLSFEGVQQGSGDGWSWMLVKDLATDVREGKVLLPGFGSPEKGKGAEAEMGFEGGEIDRDDDS
eukprot:jgi/Mesvir1/20448/Mv12345-RA.1